MSYSTETNLRIHTLSNGFTIAMERLPYLESASCGIWIKTGSAGEQPHEAGLAHFLEHLFFKGTHKRTVHQIMDDIESRGGYLNAATSREYTTLYVRMLKRHVAVGIDVLGDILLNSTFSDYEKERGVILEEIASVEDTPDELAHDVLAEYHWPNHPLGRPVSGYAAIVAKAQQEDFRRFYDVWYQPGNMVFSIAGNFDEEQVLQQAETLFGGLPSSETPAMESEPTFQAGVKLVERPISQAHIGIAVPGPAAQDDRRYACHLLANVLGGGGSSRLFELIREEEGLAYSVYAYHTNHIPTGMMGVYEAVSPQNTQRALDLSFNELRRMREELVSKDELNRAREQIKGSILMALEGTSARMARMAKNLLFMGRIITTREVIDKIDAVTAQNIRDCAQHNFQMDRCALVLLGPPDTYTPAEVSL